MSLLWGVSGAFGQTTTWYFGEGLALDFSQTPPLASEGPILTDEGCAVVTNPSGKVLFSTDGSKLFDARGNLVTSSLKGNYSSTHSALIVPHPRSPCNRFFVFTVGSADSLSFPDGLQVTEVRLTNGHVQVSSSVPLRQNVTEKLAATDDGNGGYWVVAHDYDTTHTGTAAKGRSFFAYHITANSARNALYPVMSVAGTNHQGVSPFSLNYWNGIGQMKFSPQGNLLALAIYERRQVEIFNFDKRTGRIDLAASLPSFRHEFPGAQIYGVEFSPSGKNLYVSSGFVSRGDSAYVWGFNLEIMNNTSIYYSRKLVASHMATDSLKYPFGGMLLGPDAKIYIARRDEKFISCINEPNNLRDPGFVDTALQFTDYCLLSLPTTIKTDDCSFGVDPCQLWSLQAGRDTSICAEDSVLLGPRPVKGFRYAWNTGDTTSRIYCFAGNTYSVEVTDSLGCVKTASLDVSLPPDMNRLELPKDTVGCAGHNLSLEILAPHTEVLWQKKYEGSAYEVREEGKVEVDLFNACDTLHHSFEVWLNDCSCLIQMPDAFTPNRDGINDLFEVKPQCQLDYYSLEIFDRWGELMFRSNKIGMHWDGHYHGREAAEGVYLYFLTYKASDDEERYLKGHLSLLR